MLAGMLLALAQDAPKVVRVERDDVEVRESCTLVCGAEPIADDEGDGVVQIVGDGLTVTFGDAPLVGAAAGATPDTYGGIGVRITGKDVTLRGARVRGFKGGIWASAADGLVLERCDVSGNFRQRLRSTPRAEAGEDWLWPHHDDDDEWLKNYGAGIYVQGSRRVTIRECFAREGQNGIGLRQVEDSQVYDNDMSWLSGWGLALYRSSRNVVARNSFDFCIRGYSHGVYARGQDSAGILCFEQCCDNVFALNSATHGGDGFFGFAGLEALEGGLKDAGVGCNRNLLYGNDFSYAAAIGIEMTFSYENRYVQNRLVGSNYGVWGGYSGRTLVLKNEIAENTLAGIAIEHGSHWRIRDNTFAKNARAVELWWDEDADLLAKPWAKLNPTDSTRYTLEGNRFAGDKVQLELRRTTAVTWQRRQSGTDRATWKVDAASEVLDEDWEDVPEVFGDRLLENLPGKRTPVGMRRALDGRDKIIVTEWGPYDWVAPLLQRVDDRDGAHVWRLLGNDVAISAGAGDEVVLRMDASAQPPQFVLSARKPGVALPYVLKVRVPSRELSASGVLFGNTWHVTVGRTQADPRTDAVKWRAEVEAGVSFDAPRLALHYGQGGPSELADVPQAVKDAHIGADHFGTLATTSVALPKGRWKLVTNSDDGVRVALDGALKIDNWTWHGPTTDSAEFELAEARTVAIEVQHFELDGFAVLELELAPLP